MLRFRSNLRVSLLSTPVRSIFSETTHPLPVATKEGLKAQKEAVDAILERVSKAQQAYAMFSQDKVDSVFRAAALAAAMQRVPLAQLAVEDTKMGIMEDKVIKNHFASEYVYHKYKDEKTCDVIEEDKYGRISKVASPLGTIAAVIPCTNPTSTVMFKALLSLKTRNGVIFSPHPRALKASAETARVIHDAAVKAGAPPNIVATLPETSVALTQYVMQHPKVNFILATGGGGMVSAAYSSGKPAIGVGAGNTPVVIDETANVPMAVASVVLSKSFDNGMICASEQAVFAVDSVYDEVRAEFEKRGCRILNREEANRLGAVITSAEGKTNAEVVGQTASTLAKMANISLTGSAIAPPLLVAEATEIGPKERLSYEKLCPTVSLYRVRDFDQACDKALSYISFGGVGHTACLYTHTTQAERIRKFEVKMPSGRVLINTPASQGAIGDIYNFRTSPSLTLGTGSWGRNSTSENLNCRHLLNIKTAAERIDHMEWFQVPPKIFHRTGIVREALVELAALNVKHVFLMTDAMMVQHNYANLLTKPLQDMGIKVTTFTNVPPDPTYKCVVESVEAMTQCQPDCIIALGGGSVMDASKVARVLYEHPSLSIEHLYARFMDIRKRIFELPDHGTKVKALVMVPTTSGTGSEVTPFAVITDDHHHKYPTTSYRMTPDMVILDPVFALTMPRGLTANSGFDALSHGVEAYVSVMATPFTTSLARTGIAGIMATLPTVYKDLEKNPAAREQMHNYATLNGMAFANAFLGLGHAMAHQLGGAFGIPHGKCMALVLSQVVMYNATDHPSKMVAFPEYEYPTAKQQYADLAVACGLTGKNNDEKVLNFIEAVEGVKKACGLPLSIKECGISEADFMAQVPKIALGAFDDQCIGTNPRYPLVREIADLYVKAYHGWKRPADNLIP